MNSVWFAGQCLHLGKLSAATGIDDSSLSRIFRGKRVPRLAHIRKICEAMGIKLDEFSVGLDKQYPQTVTLLPDAPQSNGALSAKP